MGTPKLIPHLPRSTNPISIPLIDPRPSVYAWFEALKDPRAFFTQQTPVAAATIVPFPPQALAQSLQIANIFLLLALLALVCTCTASASVSRNYLLAVAVADWGHIYASYRAMGAEAFWDVGAWNSMAWGNV